MAYITKSNAQRIIRQVDVKSVKVNSSFYHTDIDFLSMNDKKKLIALKELLEDSETFIKNAYQPLLNKDTMTYVYEGGKPAYHKNLDCERLVSNFYNYEIPESIKKGGREMVREFRAWFRVNECLLNQPDVFLMRLNSKFGLTEQINPINMEISGVEEIDNLNLEEVELRISQLLEEKDLYFETANERKKYVINKYQKATGLAYLNVKLKDNDTGYSDEVIKRFLKKYHQHFKKPLLTLLKQYYTLKYNPTLEFDGHLLDHLGFKPCALCNRI